MTIDGWSVLEAQAELPSHSTVFHRQPNKSTSPNPPSNHTSTCSAHPSSRAHALSLLPATSPPLLCAWPRELPAPVPPGQPAPLEGQSIHKYQLDTLQEIGPNKFTVTPSPSVSAPPRSSTFARKRRLSTDEPASPADSLTPRIPQRTRLAEAEHS